ncbi:MAG: hypothetical protein H6Q89_1033 [Myxococcaceae bacterium]|nr:hypothetical protein [Myxococcaceae bacterium]
MRSNLLILAVLCLSVSARAADGGPVVAAKDAKPPPAAAPDAGPAVDVSQELNKTMGAMQTEQSAIAQAHSTIEAELKQWLAAKATDAGMDKKLGKLKAAEEALITRHAGMVKKHAELVAKLETLAKEHAEKKIDDKKAKASHARLVKDQQKLTADHQALLAEHARRIGTPPAADGGLADAGVAGGPADAGSSDAGSSDAGSSDAGAAAAAAAVVDAGLAAAAPAPVDAGAPVKPAESDGCSAAGGTLGWTLVSTLALLRRSRRRSV